MPHPMGWSTAPKKIEKKSGRRERNIEKVPNFCIYRIDRWLAGEKNKSVLSPFKKALRHGCFQKAELLIGRAHRIAPCPAQKCLFLLISYLRARGIAPWASDAGETHLTPAEGRILGTCQIFLRAIWKEEVAASSRRSCVSAVPLLRLREGFAGGNSSRLV